MRVPKSRNVVYNRVLFHEIRTAIWFMSNFTILLINDRNDLDRVLLPLWVFLVVQDIV